MSELIRVQNDFTAPLDQAGYSLRRGWNATIAHDLISLSEQSHIREFTPNDSGRRFNSSAAAEQWHDRTERAVYTIAHHAVAGLIWFGAARNEHVEGDYTFAIRMYEESQGKGLARPFMQAAHADFREHTGYSRDIWLETDIANQRAVSLYEKVAYEKRLAVDGRYVMTQSPDQSTD